MICIVSIFTSFLLLPLNCVTLSIIASYLFNTLCLFSISILLNVCINFFVSFCISFFASFLYSSLSFFSASVSLLIGFSTSFEMILKYFYIPIHFETNRCRSFTTTFILLSPKRAISTESKQ